ncbi:unnamed protein product [Dimorphilus gyrociliatus]|uniref:RING-type domain-containing protein n=1 Tax=Dimorphilus gyrociliatus TaxID=2664684 RepID=A0A7I8V741_9ANNE|nr:unnamed protein product [Dimorphilus gyrociliatus]
MGTDYASPITPVTPGTIWSYPSVIESKIENNMQKDDLSEDNHTKLKDKKEKRLKKKLKWRKCTEIVNFSLPPRDNGTQDWTEEMINDYEIFNNGLGLVSESLPEKSLCKSTESGFSRLTQLVTIESIVENTLVINGTRRTKKRKILKAYHQVKTKYCQNVTNGGLQKELFMKSRVYKIFQRRGLTRGSGAIVNNSDKLSSKERKRVALSKFQERLESSEPLISNTSYSKSSKNASYERKHAITSQRNAANDLDIELVNLLMELQNRDIRPEDYDVLLRLDETVAPKTVDNATVKSFNTIIVSEEMLKNQQCTICMEVYEIGQTCKKLPCEHVFHDNCISQWLLNCGKNCPLDGLEV